MVSKETASLVHYKLIEAAKEVFGEKDENKVAAFIDKSMEQLAERGKPGQMEEIAQMSIPEVVKLINSKPKDTQP